MGDEHAGRRHVPPAEVPGAQAEIVLLAVALREHVGAEPADRVEAVAPQVHAEADRDRDIDHRAGIGARGQRIQPDRCRQIGHRIVVRLGPG